MQLISKHAPQGGIPTKVLGRRKRATPTRDMSWNRYAIDPMAWSSYEEIPSVEIQMDEVLCFDLAVRPEVYILSGKPRFSRKLDVERICCSMFAHCHFRVSFLGRRLLLLLSLCLHLAIVFGNCVLYKFPRAGLSAKMYFVAVSPSPRRARPAAAEGNQTCFAPPPDRSMSLSYLPTIFLTVEKTPVLFPHRQFRGPQFDIRTWLSLASHR